MTSISIKQSLPPTGSVSPVTINTPATTLSVGVLQAVDSNGQIFNTVALTNFAIPAGLIPATGSSYVYFNANQTTGVLTPASAYNTNGTETPIFRVSVDSAGVISLPVMYEVEREPENKTMSPKLYSNHYAPGGKGIGKSMIYNGQAAFIRNGFASAGLPATLSMEFVSASGNITTHTTTNTGLTLSGNDLPYVLAFFEDSGFFYYLVAETKRSEVSAGQPPVMPVIKLIKYSAATTLATPVSVSVIAPPVGGFANFIAINNIPPVPFGSPYTVYFWFSPIGFFDYITNEFAILKSSGTNLPTGVLSFQKYNLLGGLQATETVTLSPMPGINPNPNDVHCSGNVVGTANGLQFPGIGYSRNKISNTRYLEFGFSNYKLSGGAFFTPPNWHQINRSSDNKNISFFSASGNIPHKNLEINNEVAYVGQTSATIPNVATGAISGKSLLTNLLDFEVYVNEIGNNVFQ